MENISEHITYKEATQSNTAIRKCIDNTPDASQFAAMKLLAVHVFEPLRAWYKKPIYFESFFRSAKLNKEVKGASNSQHVLGEAIDLDVGEENYLLFDWLKKNAPYDQLIWEFGDLNNPAWVHVSYSKRNRREVLRAKKVNSQTVYEKI